MSIHLYCRTMNIRKFLWMFVFVLALVALSACGAYDAGDSVMADVPAEEEGEAVLILQPDAVFTVDDVEAAGWKNSRELSPETLPGATSVWYGFYRQRDVEVRVYESQASAISDGQEIADVATGRRKPTPFASGGISSTRTSYSAYGIVGNLILLCEIKIEDCQGLLESIE
ncbi:hypothetical protein GKO48_04620 [Candidatus Lucifugimonas marina]|uniref:DUF6810 domain-containing protein n=2 Tax=Candidatus Lucifugimonas marina TaxID=3038979 RepID=A0AAJ5ZHD3_9CHLR|nr:hypothetical protein GKO48_04620 [SAR202 cluster bacterium JH1073]